MWTTLPSLVLARKSVLVPWRRPIGFGLVPAGLRTPMCSSRRSLAQLQSSRATISEFWFTSSSPPCRQSSSNPENAPPDERTLKMGKTLHALQTRLPTLLASPLPTEILSPHITLHLFPSTHPHLPTVSGRVAYHAALWTAPMAWGRVPIVGNVKLIILSERMVKTGPTHSGVAHSDTNNERLIVRWKTCGKSQRKGMGALYRGIRASEQVDKITEWLGGVASDDEEFGGKFVFEFDEEGRVFTHTIEHADENGDLEKTSKVVSVTDWLLGKPWKNRAPGLVWNRVLDANGDLAGKEVYGERTMNSQEEKNTAFSKENHRGVEDLAWIVILQSKKRTAEGVKTFGS